MRQVLEPISFLASCNFISDTNGSEMSLIKVSFVEYICFVLELQQFSHINFIELNDNDIWTPPIHVIDGEVVELNTRAFEGQFGLIFITNFLVKFGYN